MRSKKNILLHTFIGLPVEIVQSTSKPLTGIKGTIIDETKNMFIIETDQGKEKKVQKIACVFRLKLESNETVDIVGKEILFRPEERAKKVA